VTYATNLKLPVIVGTALLLAAALFPTAGAAPGSVVSRGRCIGYPPEISFGGTIGAQRDQEVFSWRTTCTSAVYASVTGALQISIQEQVSGGWRLRAAGAYAHVPDLGPGTYRLVVTNRYTQSTTYTVRHRRGMG